MIFTVPEDFEGSFVLNTLKKALSRGMTVSISGNDLYAPDVKMAIKRGSLISIGDDYDESNNLSSEAMIVNRTDKILVLGKIILRPWASMMVSKDDLDNISIIAAEKNDFVHIISDEVSYETSKKAKKKVAKKKSKAKKKIVKKEEIVEEVFEDEEVFDEEKDQFIPGAEREVTPKVWNFREQESVEAQVVPTTPDIIQVDEPEVEDVEFVDESSEVQKTAPKAKTKKKASKKKASKKKAKKKATKKKAVKKTIKKKGKAQKKKKVKAIEPVGDKKIPKTQMDAAIELDSRGRPLENASDALNHMVDSAGVATNVSFVDDEQAQNRYENRTDMD